MMQAAFFQHASVAGTTRFSSCRRNSTSAFFASTTTTTKKKKRVAVLRSPVRAHHGPDYVAQFEPENAAGGGLIIAAALLGRYLSTGKAFNCSGLVDPVEGMSNTVFLSEKLPCIVGMLATSTVLPHLGLSHLLPAGGFELIEGTSRLALALFLVGFGSKLGGGCTSGHGLSGIGRLSSRSIVNVCTFMIFGALAATMFNTNALLHVVTENGKGKAVAAVNAITNTAAATQADKALYGKIIASALAGFTTIAYLAKNDIIIKRGSRAADVVKSAVHGATGVLFGVGLCVGGMVNPAKVSTFLQFTQSTWDPSLAVLMGAALAAIIPGVMLIKKQCNAPTFGDEFDRPDPGNIDTKLILGGAIFGTGWGLAGLCPGPLFVNLGAAFANQSISATGGIGLAFLSFWVGRCGAQFVKGCLDSAA